MTEEQRVTTSERLWSEEVEALDTGKEDKTAYEFSNGRRFDWPDAIITPTPTDDATISVGSGGYALSPLAPSAIYAERITMTPQNGSVVISGQVVGVELPWTPAALFASGEVGVWYDPSDLSTMFQNSNGTTAVAVGDPVGYIADKSGNGKHATQANAASRPVLRQDASDNYYLEFDGTDDFLVTSAINFSATDKMSMFAGVTKASGAGFQYAFGVGGITAGAVFIYAPSSVKDDYGIYIAGQTGSNNKTTNTTFSDPITNTLTIEINGAESQANQSKLRVNGSAEALTSGAAMTLTSLVNGPVYIGRREGSDLPFNGHIYSLIIRGVTSDATAISNAETYVAGKTGVTL